MNVTSETAFSQLEVCTTHADKRRECSFDALSTFKRVAELERDVKLAELELMAVIASEIDENGKARYSNAEKREAELVKRSAEAGLNKTKQEIEEQKFYASARQLDAQYHADMIRILCAFGERETR